MELESRFAAPSLGGVGLISGLLTANNSDYLDVSNVVVETLTNPTIISKSPAPVTDSVRVRRSLPEVKVYSVSRLIRPENSTTIQDTFVSYEAVYGNKWDRHIEGVVGGTKDGVFNWCWNAKAKEKTGLKYKFWCEDRESVFKDLDEKYSFSEEDYKALHEDLKNIKFQNEENYLLGKNSKKQEEAMHDWCQDMSDIPFIGDEEIVEVVKRHCFNR